MIEEAIKEAPPLIKKKKKLSEIINNDIIENEKSDEQEI